MDIRQIQYFVCLYEEGNVTRAARRLNVVQSALSNQLARLEAETGQKLFERTPQGMLPTQAGRTLFSLFLPILRDIANAKEEIARLGEEVSGDLRVGFLESTSGVLSEALSEYTERHPRVVIRAINGYSSFFIDQVTAGQLDIALINRPRQRLALNATSVIDEEMVVVAAAGNDLGFDRDAGMRDLAAYPLVVPSRQHGLRGVIDRHANLAGIELTPRLEIDALSAIVDLVTHGRWVTILPLITVHRGLEQGVLRAYRLGTPSVTRSLTWIHHPRRPLGAAAAQFMEIFGRHLVATAQTAARLAGREHIA